MTDDAEDSTIVATTDSNDHAAWCVCLAAVSGRSLQSSGQSSVPASPVPQRPHDPVVPASHGGQQLHQLSYERPQLPDYESAVQHLNERRRQIASASAGAGFKHSRIHSLDFTTEPPH